MLTDSFARKIEYLRLSVTDLCNLRCQYCMPLHGANKQERTKILSFEEMARLVRIFTELGVRRVRITGGEPLVRKDLPKFIAMLNEIPALEEILLTTNGFRLEQLAPELKAAGLKRINIHLDTLDPNKYSQIMRRGDLSDALKGIQAAQAAELGPIKLNSVLMKDYNDTDILSMAEFAAEQGLILRFIELMPIGPGKAMQDRFLPTKYVLDELAKRWTVLPYSQRLGHGPAEYYKIVELDAVIGLIHAVSSPFCDKCNRLRIGADGHLQDCLAYDDSVDIRQLLRSPDISDEQLSDAVRRLVGLKREDHGGFMLPQYKATCGMYGIGG